ncbi:MAG TPA: methyltransferase domain-containing protein [Vicinamibacterales bacterium]|nr:methyltransferase domain-containing protein [Vicinamibacterales bacterium]
MDAKLQRRIQRYGWDKAAASYEGAWERQLAPAHRAVLDEAELQPGERVLDVACGTGLVTFAAADAVARWGMVFGTDLSEQMVEQGRARARERGCRHVWFERADAEALHFPSGVFDAALCALGLMYVPDAAAAVAEMARVLAPGGRAVVAVWGPRERCGWAEIFPIVDARVKPEVCPLFFALGTGDRLAAAFRGAGLTGVTTERVATRLEWASAEDACGAAFVGGPVALAHSRFDEATRIAAYGEYLSSIERFRVGEGYHVPGEFVIVSGRKTE